MVRAGLRVLLIVGLLIVAPFGLGRSPAYGQQKTAGSEAAGRQFNTAGKLQDREQFDLAADEWAKFIKTYPSDPLVNDARHYLGVCQSRNGQYADAVATFEKLIADKPTFDLLELTYLNLGLAQYNLGKSGQAAMYDKASQTLAAQVAKFPQGQHAATALYYEGEVAFEQGKKQAAVSFYEQVVRVHPKDALVPDALYALGVTQSQLGQHAFADASFAAFLQSYPNHNLATEVGVRRGDALFAQGKIDEAEKLFAAAAAKPGFNLADYATLRQGVCLGERKQYAQAAALFATIPQKFPQSKLLPDAQLSAGRCLYLNGQYADARAALAKVAGQSDLAPEAVHWMARSLLKEKQPAEALKVVEPWVGKAGQSAFAVALEMDRADALYDTPQRQREAVAAYAKLAELHPNDTLAPEALYMAGFTSLGLRDYDAASTHAQAFLKRFSNSSLVPDVMYVVAESQLLNKKYAEAEQSYADLLKKYPQHEQSDVWRVRQALAMFHSGKFQPSAALLESIARRLRPADLAAEGNHLLGLCYHELKQYGRAAKALEASLAANPKWSRADEVLLADAYAYRADNKLAEAKARLTRLTTDFPNSRLLDRAHYLLGEYADVSKDFATATGEYRQVVEKWPQSELAPAAMHGLAWAQHMQKDDAGALKTLDALLQTYAKSEEARRARFTRGLVREELKQFGPAVDDFQAYLQTKPSKSEQSTARYELGRSLIGLNKSAEAIDTFNKLLADDPQYASGDQVLYELAWAFKTQGKEAEAADAFGRLVKQYPNSSVAGESLFHVGDYYYQQKDYTKAAKSLYEAQAKAGKTPLGETAMHKLGFAYFRQQDYASAQQTFQSQRAMFPQGELISDALFMEGESLFKLGKHKEAVAAYEQVKNPKGKDFLTLARLHSAQSLGVLKEWSRSLEILEKLAKDDAQSAYLPEILYEQGWAMQNLGRSDEALSLYETVTNKTEAEVAARARFMVGEIYFERKNHTEAVKNFFKVAYGYPFTEWQAAAQYEAGRCFEVLGKKTQARQSYQEIVDKYPKSDKVELARQRLTALGS